MNTDRTHQLLMALCEALGFKVVVNHDSQERTMGDREFERMMKHEGFQIWSQCTDRNFKGDNQGGYFRDENGNRVTRLITPIVTYALVKEDSE